MSHYTTVKLQLTDKKALEDAIKNMGLELKHDIPCRPGKTVYKDVIKMPGMYDCAVIEDDDSYTLVYRPFTSAERILGQNGEILLREYAIAKLEEEAKKIKFKCVKKGDNKVILFNPSDPKQQLEVDFDSDVISMHAKGFSGSSCTVFQPLEKALGSVIDVQYTGEFYSPENAEKVHLNQYS